MNTEYYLIAEVRAVADADGFVFLELFTDFPERFEKNNIVLIDVFGELREFVIEEVEFNNKNLLVKFKNFDEADDVKFLVKKKIFILGENLIQLEKDSYYVHDLIGCEVFQGKNCLGKLKDVISNPWHDVYVVNSPERKEILIPAVREFIDNVDPVNNMIRVRDEVDLGEFE